MSDRQAVVEARHKRNLARERVVTSLDIVRARTRPGVLARKAADRAQGAMLQAGNQATDAARKRPFIALGALGLAGVILGFRMVRRHHNSRS
ncbi:hypothetical protein GCM10023219_23630 [Stakelama sediminis]|uniref:ElaB/YqjD/DUF883 family membrane-anchored ribosome-binding protein n=1 Tax=Stakelama sediminis TaxID=463200 RepID=A0A840YZM5_9SPHN|nr:hypothetical protein [Stakelama sediminis]MBB5718960.1 ElaB/YqjD/DUF883 family membrane-anchored ribosome-binding protein [Stakelama sediminis]